MAALCVYPDASIKDADEDEQEAKEGRKWRRKRGRVDVGATR